MKKTKSNKDSNWYEDFDAGNTMPKSFTILISQKLTIDEIIEKRGDTDFSKFCRLALNWYLFKLATEGDEIALNWVRFAAENGSREAKLVLERLKKKP